jgi:hypothetical protein
LAAISNPKNQIKIETSPSASHGALRSALALQNAVDASDRFSRMLRMWQRPGVCYWRQLLSADIAQTKAQQHWNSIKWHTQMSCEAAALPTTSSGSKDRIMRFHIFAALFAATAHNVLAGGDFTFHSRYLIADYVLTQIPLVPSSKGRTTQVLASTRSV